MNPKLSPLIKLLAQSAVQDYRQGKHELEFMSIALKLNKSNRTKLLTKAKEILMKGTQRENSLLSSLLV